MAKQLRTWEIFFNPYIEIMRILICIDSLNFGGAEKQAVFDANALSRRGLDIYFCYFVAGPLAMELDDEIIQFKIRSSSYLGRILALKRAVHQFKIDIIFAHMFRAEIICSLAGFLSKKPVVFNEHGLGLWRKRSHILAYKLASSGAKEIWCASEYCRKLRIEREGISSNKLKTVYNSYTQWNHNNVRHDKFRNEILINNKENTVIIGFVGRFDPVKRLHLLVDVAADCPFTNILFVLVGDGPEKSAIESIIRKRRLENKFLLPGFIHEPIAYYEKFDLFVMPSERESLSVALLEAGSRGLPCIAFDVGGNAEIIIDGKTGCIIPQDDCQAFRQAIYLLVRDSQKRQSMGQNASRYICEHFSGEKRIQCLLKTCSSYVL
ncbi:MAG: glycosyltransferase [Deltaproteobacteria bacterium]|nr:glycosyltransferase [Deltaproteobacteria bacterium]